MSFQVTQTLEDKMLAFVQKSSLCYCTSQLFALQQYQEGEVCIYSAFVGCEHSCELNLISISNIGGQKLSRT